MKLLFCVAAAAALMATSALAQPDQRDTYRAGYQAGYRAGYDDAQNGRDFDDHMRNRDEDRYRDNGDNGPPPDDRDQRWRQRYSQDYSYRDDSFYQQCRTHTDPAGVIAGALIGGLVGNAASRGNAGATVAGVVVGGAAGAALSSSTECGDRSYIYKTYYDGFNAGRDGRTYRWYNPGTGNSGGVRTDRYYNDEDGFRCVDFSQSFRINGDKRERRGTACQEPNGTWAVVR